MTGNYNGDNHWDGDDDDDTAVISEVSAFAVPPELN